MFPAILFLISNSISPITQFGNKLIPENGKRSSIWIETSNVIVNDLFNTSDTLTYVPQTFSDSLCASSHIVYMCGLYISAFGFIAETNACS